MDVHRPMMPGGRPARPSQRVDAACDRFEAAWRAGAAPRIEDYVDRADDADRPALLGELLALERELRRGGGQPPAVEEYLARFPGQAGVVRATFGGPLGPDERPPAPPRDAGRDLLLGVLALQNDFISREDLLAAFAAWVADRARPLARILADRGALDEARRALLEALVGEHLKRHDGDAQASLAAVRSLGPVRAELERLGDPDLQASLVATILRAAAPDAARATADEARPPRRAGARFRVLRFHREGGLGRVYLARDEELGREVALKEIRRDKAAAADLRTRFVLEAEITGGLEHPGIVPVYSLGAHDDGRPFYAMRFVEGDSLKEAIEAYHGARPRPDPGGVEFRRLLGRFVDICDAIAFAHGRGVLHRDIKPGNVILGRHGETLVVDWGLAKATGRAEPGTGERGLVPSSASGSAETLPGSALGTPAYMSPEQAGGDLGAVGPWSDVYSLGATLYCLLCGRPPFEGEPNEVLRAVRRGALRPPRSIDPALDRALEAVCLKAMALRPEVRYGSCRALAEDVERWLADEPVSAWREPPPRRAGRWARRHRTAVVGAAAAALVGLIGLAAVAVVLTWSYRELKAASAETSRALKAETQALVQSEEARRRAEAVLGFLKEGVLAAARPEGQEGGLGVGATVRQAVDAAEPKIAGSFRDQPIVEADVRTTLGDTYLLLVDCPLAIRQYARAAELRRSKLGPDHPDTLQSRDGLAKAYFEAGRIIDAIKLHEATLAQRESKLGPDHPDVLSSRDGLAKAYVEAGRTIDAIKLHKATLAQRESRLGPDHPDVLSSRNNLAIAYIVADRPADAIRLLEAALAQRESTLGPDHPDLLSSRNNLAGAYQADDRIADAIKLHEANLRLCESKLGPDHLHTLVSRNNLASAYQVAGRTDDAIELLEANLRLYESNFVPDHPNMLKSRHNLALGYRAAGRTADAIGLLEANLKRRESKLGPDHPDTLTSRVILANTYQAAGQTGDAIKLLKANLEQQESRLGPDHFNTLCSRDCLAAAYMADGKLDRSVPLFERALDGLRATVGTDHPRTLSVAQRLADAYAAVGQYSKADAILRGGLERARQQFGPAHPRTASLLATLGFNLIQQRKWSEAEPVLLECLAIRQRVQPDDWRTFNTRSLLGASLLGQEKFAEAEPLLLAGYEGMKAREARIPPGGRPGLVQAAVRVEHLYEVWGKPDRAAAWKRKLGLADLPANVFARP
jgi:tetratricopeptide (TPR) repeat protein/tRNA A-37 threonylcarbamoyl transferase component Bud32